MNVLLVFDTVQGNTEKIARAISKALAPVDVKMLRPGEVDQTDFKSIDLFIAGSPTMGGKPTSPMQEFLSGLPAGALNGIDVVAFDTRIPAKWVKIFGYAAEKIAVVLKNKGGRLAAPAEGFIVGGSKGPLKEGELERASAWIKGIETSKY